MHKQLSSDFLDRIISAWMHILCCNILWDFLISFSSAFVTASSRNFSGFLEKQFDDWKQISVHGWFLLLAGWIFLFFYSKKYYINDFHLLPQELNLDLVQFPRPVLIHEVRVVPLGTRVTADFPGGVRLGWALSLLPPSQPPQSYFQSNDPKFVQIGIVREQPPQTKCSHFWETWSVSISGTLGLFYRFDLLSILFFFSDWTMNRTLIFSWTLTQGWLIDALIEPFDEHYVL